MINRLSWREAQRRSHPAYFSPRVSRRSSVSTPQPISPNFLTTDAPEQTRIKTGNQLHLRDESFAAPIGIVVGLDLGSSRSVGRAPKREPASRKVRPYMKKSVARAVQGVGPDLVSGRSVRRAPKRRNGLTQGEALPLEKISCYLPPGRASFATPIALGSGFIRFHPWFNCRS